jgi:creatinine amidohydrolase
VNEMTTSFAYEILTWPDVAALPRQTPLVIPLGYGYDYEVLAGQLGNPPQVGFLPPVPFGWEGSLLPVSLPLLANLLDNLLGSLREDGFTQVFVLVPPGLNLGLKNASEILEISPQEMRRLRPTPAEASEVDHQKVVLIPIGHTEQHGFHLPLNTDTTIIRSISVAVAGAIPSQVFDLPAMPYGVSTHRASFAGTLNAGGRAFEDFWLGAIDALDGLGFKMVYLISGHGGNCSFLTNVVKYAGERHPDMFCATAWLYLSGPQGIRALEEHRRSPLGGMGHACELETALMLHLSPHLVQMQKAVDETSFISTPSYYMDWVEEGALIANPPWEDDSQTGAYGAGSLATAENGRIWFETAVAEKVAHVAEIIQQQQLRSARRMERRQFGVS